MTGAFPFSWKQEAVAILGLMAGGVFLGALVARVAMGGQFIFVLSYVTFAIGGLVLVSNGVAGVVVLIFRRGLLSYAVRVSVACMLLMLISFLFMPVENAAWRQQMAIAKAYPKTVEPQLEAFRKSQGHYPASLDAIPGLPSLPTGLTYRVDSETFYFVIADLDLFFPGTYYYSGTVHEWYTDD